jgi:hypothetical protein
MRWSSAAKVPSLIRRRRGGLTDEQARERRMAVEFAVAQEPELFELVGS